MSAAEELLSLFIRPTRILYVEDEETVGRVFVNLLERDFECSIVWAKTGTDAIAVASRQEFDIVFLDLLLPDMTGIQVLRSLRTKRPSIPVIVTTGYLSSDLVMDAAESGVACFLSKPFGDSINFGDIFSMFKVRARSKEDAAYFDSRRRVSEPELVSA